MNQGTCTNVNEDGDECSRPVFSSSPASLCQLHIMVAAQFAVEMQWFETAAMVKSKPSGNAGKPRFKYGVPTIVYYMLKGARIKIGTTTNLDERMKAIPHDRVLAIEPGGFDVERFRHHQFAVLRVDGEWFTAKPDLVAHVKQVRAEHGEPIKAWKQIMAEYVGS